MCGIHGFTGNDRRRLFRMIGSAAHRGPDGVGQFEAPRISLGQNLLAIMDVPDQSRQPWRLDGSGAVLCFNGQIYNHQDLAQEFRDRVRTHCDTEILALGLEAHGEAFLEKLDGMYAIAFYDPRRQELLVARDPAGMKPLYYNESNGIISFSSELRALLVGLDDVRLDHLATTIYFQLGYVPGPKTLVDGIKRLVPGEWRRYCIADGALVASGFTGRRMPDTREYKPGEFRGALRQSVASCAMGLRPLGLYLSGGLDSSMILHEAVELGVPLTTFSTRFVGDGLDAFNEDADLAKQLAAHYGVSHVEVPVREQDFVSAFQSVVDVIEEPRYNRSSPAYLVTARALAQRGIVVTLAGDGGDEMLAGYPKYLWFETLRERGAFAPMSLNQREELLTRLRDAGYWRWPCGAEIDLTNPVHRWYYISKFRLEERGLSRGLRDPSPTEEILAYLETWLGAAGGGDDMLNDLLAKEQTTWLPEDALIRNDKIGMSFGMEGRYPLVTRAFREMAMALPSSMKIVNGRLKRTARWTYEKRLPSFIVDRRRKSGWAAPVLEWGSGKGALGDLLTSNLQHAGALSEYLDLEGISASREPKLIYSALNLLAWSRRVGASPRPNS